jgi:hypothetical protein
MWSRVLHIDIVKETHGPMTYQQKCCPTLTLSLTAYFLHVNALPQVSINLVVWVAYNLGHDKSPPSPPRVEEYAVLLLKPS